MKFEISATINLEHEHPRELLAVIEPENKTMKDGTVVSRIENRYVSSVIKGQMSIGTLLHTLDDLIKTAIIFNGVSESTIEE
jgi:hypothetical protein